MCVCLHTYLCLKYLLRGSCLQLTVTSLIQIPIKRPKDKHSIHAPRQFPLNSQATFGFALDTCPHGAHNKKRKQSKIPSQLIFQLDAVLYFIHFIYCMLIIFLFIWHTLFR